MLTPSMCASDCRFGRPFDIVSPCARLQARHTGIKIVQQIAILLGCAVLPHLKALVDIVKHGLTDENQKVRLLYQHSPICFLVACVSDTQDAVPACCHSSDCGNLAACCRLSAMQVKTITALTVAALAEAAAPYGIESFDDVLEPLWKGIRLLRGKVLAAFLKVGHDCSAFASLTAAYSSSSRVLPAADSVFACEAASALH